MPNIQLLDGKKIPFDEKINGFDLIKKISKSLEKKALIMEVDGNLKDLLWENHNIEIPIFEWNKEKFIRLSIHIYNDQKDIDSLMNALRSII